MKYLILILTCYFGLFLCQCTKNDPGPVIPESNGIIPSGAGVFILNEGNFTAGNGSLSYYSCDSSKIYNDIFSGVNNRPLGDVPNSMMISKGSAYIVVNNSGKIEVVDKNTILSSATITGIDSPRSILLTDSSKAYVSSLYSTKITILNMQMNSVSGYIDIRRSSEAMLLKGDKAFVSCWMSGNEIMIINTKTDKVIDSIEVGYEPESMVIDRNGRLWILCSGGYTEEYNAELDVLNTANNEIERRMAFPSATSYPTSLHINRTGDTIYYVDNAIWRMDIESSSLPVQPFIQASGRLYYKLGVDPVKGDVFATNVIDYQQRGFLLRFSASGSLIDSSGVDIIPGSLCFKLN